MSIQSNFPAIKPSLLLDFANTKQLDSRVTFTRSTPAVYYDGKTTAMAEQNLTTYSSTVGGTNWNIYNGLTISTNNATAPDGTSNATLATASDTAKQSVYQIGTLSSALYTLSIYAKAGTNSWIAFDNGVGTTSAWFNVSAGTIGTVTGGTATITSVGNGWYRCTYTISSASTFTTINGISVPNADNTTNQTIGNTVYLWGAQSELRTSATAYTPTTTQPITNYIPVLLTAGGNQPRFDCNPTTGESLGLLIEEQRTNLATYSEQFDNADWVKTNTSIISNTIISPDGQLDGDKLIENTSNGTHEFNFGSITWTSGETYTFSIFVKSTESRNIGIRLGNNTAINVGVLFNPTGGYVQDFSGGNGTLVSYSSQSVGNGWYRLCVTGTTINTTTANGPYIYLFDGTNASYTGNGFSGIYIWGAQLEVGAFATSYIATTSASATRTADIAQMTGANFSSWFNNSQGTFVAIVGTGNVSTGARVLKISETDSNRLIDFYVTSTPTQAIYSYQNGITSANYSAGTISTSKYLTAVSYATGNISGLVNGGSVTTSTSAVVSSVANSTFAIGYDPISGGSQLSRPIAKIAYYPIQVTSANLQALTS